MVPPALVK
jgi:hypothetical protein